MTAGSTKPSSEVEPVPFVIVAVTRPAVPPAVTTAVQSAGVATVPEAKVQVKTEPAVVMAPLVPAVKVRVAELVKVNVTTRTTARVVAAVFPKETVKVVVPVVAAMPAVPVESDMVGLYAVPMKKVAVEGVNVTPVCAGVVVVKVGVAVTAPEVAPAVTGTVQVAPAAEPEGMVQVARVAMVVTTELVPAVKVTATPVKATLIVMARSVAAVLPKATVKVVVPVVAVMPAVALENVDTAV